MPMHTSTTTGVVQDIFRSLGHVDWGRTTDRPLANLYLKRGTDKRIRMMTLYLICSTSAAARSTWPSPKGGAAGRRTGGLLE
jgi:hypothetical protein